jgi:N-acetylated-alpha-linked acidic dipeptidase
MKFISMSIILSLLFCCNTWAEEDLNLVGFTVAGHAAQLALEEQFDAHIEPQDISGWSEYLSRHPHHAGSEYARPNAEYLAALFTQWGFDVQIETYEIVLPTPVTRSVELVAPQVFVAGLTEDIVDDDISTQARDEVVPPYNAFSRDGDVEAELVFVNYGIPEDYEMLARYGIEVEGKIAIAKYGKSWRGIKPKLAAEHGAVGTLIYSDPGDDGYAVGDVYPKGPFKNASAVQRGSVMDMPTYAGDIQTPGRAAKARARRIPLDEVEVITKVPVLPISYSDALPLLSALDGAVVPATWRGALPITYHFGPGPARVRMKAKFDWQTIEIYNVIARLPGSEYPDEWVIRGNHHDAWNHGAADPISGLAALLAEAQAVGQLAAAGSPPKRTIIYAAWDAEEPGLIGSTEWAEDHAKALQEQAVAYINTDGNSRGFLYGGGSHTLESFFDQVSTAVVDPQTGVSLDKRRRARIRVMGTEEQRADLQAKGTVRLAPLGSGSDYTPFLQHLGIASANFAFAGEGAGGSYHTLYDTYAHYAKFRDPGFVYGATLAKTTGRVTLRLANAQVLPFRFAPLIENIAKYLEEIETLTTDKRENAELVNQQLADGVYELVLDKQKTLSAPLAELDVPHFNFAPLKNVLADLKEVASSTDEQLDQALSKAGVVKLNKLLYQSERALTRKQGLPGRPWYRHQIYAPGFYTGYGVKTLPHVREAIEAEHYDSVDEAIVETADMLRDFSQYLEQIRSEASS